MCVLKHCVSYCIPKLFTDDVYKATKGFFWLSYMLLFALSIYSEAQSIWRKANLNFITSALEY